MKIGALVLIMMITTVVLLIMVLPLSYRCCYFFIACFFCCHITVIAVVFIWPSTIAKCFFTVDIGATAILTTAGFKHQKFRE